jgi:uncharacterized repeat protein (TIGR01451 family)
MTLVRRNTPWLLLLLAAAHALTAGCAGLRCPGCPRIDPTGERFLIWPKDEVRTPVATVPPVAGNLTAPPVVTDPVFPQPSVPAVPAAAPGVPIAPTVTPASAAVAQGPVEKLAITPERILAPVNSEVVLKAAICGTEGYTLAEEKVEWMLGRSGVGQFVEVGGKGLFHPPLIPWARGTKVDNYLAHGYTATGPLCITRGTADPTDDVNINRGDAWVSVTSPNEGVSHVTAYAPSVTSWDQRRFNATIYWVDVQWTFPPGTIASSGRAETLTTLVTRQTDGMPLEGWIVRYTVADGGQPSEVRTGADGRASVQVTPTASGAPSSRIDAQLVRPAGFGGTEAPQLNIASGSTTINWSGGSPYLPPTSTQPAPSTPPVQPAPVQPLPTAPITPQGPTTPQPQLPAAAPARLEVTAQGPKQAQVGGAARFVFTIRNTGDNPATNVKLSDKLDPGLFFAPLPSKEIIGYTIGTIGPRETKTLPIDLQVSKSGSLCQDVSIEYAEGPPATTRTCITVAEAAPQREARVEVRIDGPRAQIVGQTATFHIVVRNAGQTPLVNVVTEEEYSPAVFTPQTDANVPAISGKITRSIGRLEVGEQRAFDTRCLCRQATINVTPLVRATADTDPPSNPISNADEHPMEILPQRGQPPAGAGASPPPAGATGTPLSVVLSFLNPSVLVNSASRVTVTVTNKSAAPQENVALRIYYPANVRLDVATAEIPVGVQPKVFNDRVEFSPLPRLLPNETATYRIPMNTIEVGRVDFTAQAVSGAVPGGASSTESLEITSAGRY